MNGFTVVVDGDSTPQRVILHGGCMASRMEVCISVCVYCFGYLAQKVGGQNMLLKIVWGPGSYTLGTNRSTLKS